MNVIHSMMDFINTALFDSPVAGNAAETDFSSLFVLSKKNALANVVFVGIQKAGIQLEGSLREKYQGEADKALYVYAMQSNQLENLSFALEQNRIPFIPLKGSRMRDFYPSPELRTSGDIDFLTRAEDQPQIRVMESNGFSFVKDGGTTMNFSHGAAVEVELHRCLYDENLSFHGYFDKIWDRVSRTAGWNYRYEMSENDFYVNMIAHFAKHFSRYGCGIRNAIDIALYLDGAPQSFDRITVDSLLSELGLIDFEKRVLRLIESWKTGNWSDEDYRLTEYMLGCGVFGTAKSKANHSMQNGENKVKRYFGHIFPRFEIMKGIYPVLNRVPVLLPATWVIRWFRLLLFDRKKIKTAYRKIELFDSASRTEAQDILKMLNLDAINENAKE